VARSSNIRERLFGGKRGGGEKRLKFANRRYSWKRLYRKGDNRYLGELEKRLREKTRKRGTISVARP